MISSSNLTFCLFCYNWQQHGHLKCLPACLRASVPALLLLCLVVFASLNTCLEPVCTAFLPCKSKRVGGTISNRWQRQRDTHGTLTKPRLKGDACTQSGVCKSIRCRLAGESPATAAALLQSVFAGHWPEEQLSFLSQKRICPHLKRHCCPRPCQQPVLPWLSIPQRVSLADLPLPCLWDEIR